MRMLHMINLCNLSNVTFGKSIESAFTLMKIHVLVNYSQILISQQFY